MSPPPSGPRLLARQELVLLHNPRPGLLREPNDYVLRPGESASTPSTSTALPPAPSEWKAPLPPAGKAASSSGLGRIRPLIRSPEPSRVPSTAALLASDRRAREDLDPRCGRCGRCRCTACRRRVRLPTAQCGACLCSAESVVDCASCMCCVRGFLHHALPRDEYGEPPGVEDSDLVSCSGPDSWLRWGCLSIAAVLLPCLCCYAPCRLAASATEAAYARCRNRGCTCGPAPRYPHLERPVTTQPGGLKCLPT